MDPTTLNQIAQWSDGSLIQGVPSDTASVISTDSRSIRAGEVFLALKGDHFDGHDFLAAARENGAAAIIVSTLNLETERYQGGIIHVRNTLTALQELALQYRRSLGELFVVGVTGSNGKTSTKDFIYAVLDREFSVNATAGNLNNHIGLPQTILKTDSGHEAGVWEMGMNHPGEIERLAEIAGPDAAVITNVGTAHIEFMKTREAIAEEKGMLAEAVSKDGFVILNAADDFSDAIRGRCRGKVVTAGIGCGDVQGSGLKASGTGTRFEISAGDQVVETEIGVPGEHMVANALLAAAVGIERGVALEEIAAGLRDAELTGGRLQVREISGVRFLDDSYNANPDSMRAAIGTLATFACEGRRAAVLGLMGELGDHEEGEHRSLGEFVAGTEGVDLLITAGETGGLIAKGAAGGGRAVEIEPAADQAEAAAILKEWARPGDLVLVKGSRAAAMEKVIDLYSG